MRIGLALPHYDTSYAGEPASWERVLEVARTAEAAGFDSVWVSDHLFLDWGKYGGPDTRQGCLECWTTLSALAASTSRVRLGSLALCNDLRNPALLAKMIGTLDTLSGGRLDVALGAGWYEPEYEAAGIDFDPAGERIARLGESLSAIGRLLDGEELVSRGNHYDFDGAIVRPAGVQQPRPALWVGGKGDYLLKIAARHADGWNFSWLGSLDTYRDRVEAARRACEAEGRDPSSLRRSVGAYVVTGKDESDARRRYDRLVERTPRGVLTGDKGGAGVSWEEFKTSRVAGSTAEVVDVLGGLAQDGVEEAILTLGCLPFQLSDLEDVELVGSEIVPALS